MLVITVGENKIKKRLFILYLIYPEIFLLECSCVYVGVYERFKGYIPSGRLGLKIVEWLHMALKTLIMNYKPFFQLW